MPERFHAIDGDYGNIVRVSFQKFRIVFDVHHFQGVVRRAVGLVNRFPGFVTQVTLGPCVDDYVYFQLILKARLPVNQEIGINIATEPHYRHYWHGALNDYAYNSSHFAESNPCIAGSCIVWTLLRSRSVPTDSYGFRRSSRGLQLGGLLGGEYE